MVFGGPAGIGKTTLLSALHRGAGDHGCHMIRMVGSRALRDVPFGAFTEALPDLASATARVTEVAGRLMAAFGRRLAVTLDDAPLADDATVALLQLLIQRRQAFLFTTVRHGQPLPDPLAQLWRAGQLAWLEVPPLGHDDVARLVHRAVGREVDGATVADLASLSGGNPLFVRELICAAVDQGLFAEHRGVWTMPGRPRLPDPLADLLGQRIAGVPPAVLDAVQLVGELEPVELALLSAVVDRAAIEEGERLGLVRADIEGRRCRLRLSDPLVGEVLRQRRGQCCIRHLWAAFADELAARGLRREGDALRLARCHLAGTTRPEIPVLLRATRQAVSTFDHPLVVRLGQVAERLGAGFPARLAVAGGLAWSGEFERAEALYAQVQRAAVTDAERGRVARDRAVNLFFGLGRVRLARNVMAAARRSVTDPRWYAELGLLDAGIAINLGRSAEALRLSAAASLDPIPQELWLHRLPGQVSTLSGLGETAAALDTGEAALDAVERAADRYPYLAVAAKVALAEACVLHGSLERADALAGAGQRDAARRGADGPRGQWALVRARTALLRGRLSAAIEEFRQAAALLDRNPTLLGRTGVLECRAGLAIGYALRGDQVPATAALAQAEDLALEDCFSPTLAQARAWLPALRGDRAAALAAALAAAATNAELGNHGFEVAPLYLAALLGAQPAVAERLAELADRDPGPLRLACAQHAIGLVQRDGATLERAAAAFAAIGALPFAAQAATDAARAHTAAGRRAEAVLAAERGRTHLSTCPRYTLLNTAGPAQLPALTRREREVAALAAAGLANAEIASRMVLSVRTVETHLSNIYAKVGRSGRAALTALFPVSQGASTVLKPNDRRPPRRKGGTTA